MLFLDDYLIIGNSNLCSVSDVTVGSMDVVKGSTRAQHLSITCVPSADILEVG